MRERKIKPALVLATVLLCEVLSTSCNNERETNVADSACVSRNGRASCVFFLSDGKRLDLTCRIGSKSVLADTCWRARCKIDWEKEMTEAVGYEPECKLPR